MALHIKNPFAGLLVARFSRAGVYFLLILSGIACSSQLNPTQPSNGSSHVVTYPLPLYLKTVDTVDLYSDQGTVHGLFSGISAQEGELAVLYSRSADGGQNWMAPVNVSDGIAEVKEGKRGNDFQIAAAGEKILAVWKTNGSEPWVGIMAMALSQDSGRTWHALASPMGADFAHVDQGYFDVTADQAGYFHLVWLDDREEAGNTQGLRYARLDSSTGANNSRWELVQTLEQTVCTCCWSKIVDAGNGQIHVLFRDDSPRDMKLLSSGDDGVHWRQPQTVQAFNWEFIGCPHQGGGLAVEPGAASPLHALIWNGSEGQRGLFHATAVANGAFQAAAPVSSDTGRSGDIAVRPGSVAVTYAEGIGEGKQVFFKRSDDGGRTWTNGLALSKAGAGPSHPRIVATGTGFRVFWTEWLDNGDAVGMMSGSL